MSGELTDDDEVAVMHAGAEWEFRAAQRGHGQHPRRRCAAAPAMPASWTGSSTTC